MAKKRPTPADLPTDAARQLKRLDVDLLKLLEQRQTLASQLEADELATALANETTRIERLLDKARKATRRELLLPALKELLAAERVAAGGLLRVAYLGPENTFSHLAASHRYGSAADLAPVGSIAAVFEEVGRGDSDVGVVPLENSTDGRVSDTLECFSKYPVKICGELPLRIHHCLLGSGPRGKVRTVCSKPQAISQCRNWLAQHLPKAETQAVSSTAEAANLARKDPAVAAIASERAAAQLGLGVLAANIEDQKDNITRFAVIGPEPAAKTGADKTALMFESAHQPGSLADAMAVFKRHKLNLTWIESFPIPGTRGEPTGGEYRFFAEFLGHQADLHPRKAIAALEKKTTLLTVLGSYPVTEPID